MYDTSHKLDPLLKTLVEEHNKKNKTNLKYIWFSGVDEVGIEATVQNLDTKLFHSMEFRFEEDDEGFKYIQGAINKHYIKKKTG